jgi:hypothetical protein
MNSPLPQSSKQLPASLVLKGYAQRMADGKWGGRCLVTANKGSKIQELILTSPLLYSTEQEASESGLEFGKEWLATKYPTD